MGHIQSFWLDFVMLNLFGVNYGTTLFWNLNLTSISGSVDLVDFFIGGDVVIEEDVGCKLGERGGGPPPCDLGLVTMRMSAALRRGT